MDTSRESFIDPLLYSESESTIKQRLRVFFSSSNKICNLTHILLDDTVMNGRIQPYYALITAIIGQVTVFLTWIISRRTHLPEWLYCPPISLTGFLFPERVVYLSGFILCFCVSTAMSIQVCSLLTAIKKISNHKNKFINVLILLAKWSIRSCLLGLIGQALIPFQSNTFQYIGTDEFISHIEATTIIHLFFASMLFMSAFVHGALVIIILYWLNQPVVGVRLVPQVSVRLKVSFAFCILAVIFGFEDCYRYIAFNQLHYTDDLKAELNMKGISQRLLVFFLFAYLATYSIDMHHLHKMMASF